MRKTFLIILFLSPVFLISQELDENFLESLPENIRTDISERLTEKQQLEKNVYRSVNSSSEVNRLNETDIFGSDFFNTVQSSFMPINSPSLDDEYILDFGDVLNVQLIGQIDMNESFKVLRDGSINLPDIGKLYIGGLKLGEASSLISSKIKQIYIGVESYTTLTNLRDVSVLVAGDAFNPGIYTLNGNSNLLHALHVAGGINIHGSYRSIKLIRDGETIDKLDVYDILMNGKFSINKRLRTGDIIFVDPREKIVTVSGAFKRQGNYELKSDQSLYDAIDYANGLEPDSDLSNIYLHRLLDGEIKALPISNISQFKNIIVNDGDRLFIRKHNFRDVKINGSVVRPGTYKMVEGQTLDDLIIKAGGYTGNAFPMGTVYLNEEAQKINQDANEKLYKDFVDNLIALFQKNSAGGSTDINPIMALASELKNAKATGRIVIDIKNNAKNIHVRDGDSIYIPEKTNNVFIFGEIFKNGALIYQEDKDIDFYINEASGMKDFADKDSIFIIFPDGRAKEVIRNRNIFANQHDDLTIYPGSVIYVPRKIDDTISSRLTAQAYASILGDIGVSLASISVLNKN